MTDLDADARRALLRRVQMFCSLDDADLAAIAEMATARRLAAREELFHKGDAGQQLYVVASGRLKVITTSAEGDDLIFCLLGAGEVIGEVALLVDRPRTATVVAMQASELIAIDRRDFQQLLRTRAEVAIGLLGVVAERLARVSEFVEDTQFLNLAFRLAKKINELVTEHGRRNADASRIELDLKLSQEEWGDLVGATRESINKQFKAWSEEGLIASEHGHLTILDPDRMEQLADCVVL
jgi:CRP-like cAMP-binding protein